jgi:hypothetical protein
VNHDDLARWIHGYEQAWRSPGTAALQSLFTSDAIYRPAPFDPPLSGRGAIAAFWEAERDGPDERFTMSWTPVAVEGAIAVARIDVSYTGPPLRVYRDLWVLTLDDDGRCSAFEEWPFHPQQARVATVQEAFAPDLPEPG